MSQTTCVCIFSEDQNGRFQDQKHHFTLEELGGVPAVGDVIISPFLPPVNDEYPHHGGFWEVTRRYFKPDMPMKPETKETEREYYSYIVLVVKERSRYEQELDI